MTFDNSQKGAITIYLVFIILIIVLGVSSGIGLLFTKQLRLVGEIGVSTFAFHAAEAGAERILRLDVCLIEADESARVNCIEDISGLAVDEIHDSCKEAGELSYEDEQECRKETVWAIPQATRELANSASYSYSIRDQGADCECHDDWGYCAVSTAFFGGTIRSVEIVR